VLSMGTITSTLSCIDQAKTFSKTGVIGGSCISQKLKSQ
jgi:hypothetical protein